MQLPAQTVVVVVVVTFACRCCCYVCGILRKPFSVAWARAVARKVFASRASSLLSLDSCKVSNPSRRRRRRRRRTCGRVNCAAQFPENSTCCRPLSRKSLAQAAVVVVWGGFSSRTRRTPPPTDRLRCLGACSCAQAAHAQPNSTPRQSGIHLLLLLSAAASTSLLAPEQATSLAPFARRSQLVGRVLEDKTNQYLPSTHRLATQGEQLQRQASLG